MREKTSALTTACTASAVFFSGERAARECTEPPGFAARSFEAAFVEITGQSGTAVDFCVQVGEGDGDHKSACVETVRGRARPAGTDGGAARRGMHNAVDFGMQ